MSALNIKILDNINTVLYGGNQEANEIWRITQPELDNGLAEVRRIFSNTRVSDADIDGIEIWERVYNIMPNINDDIETRRDDVLVALRTTPPFTEHWMQERLAEKFPAGEVTYKLDGLRLDLLLDVGFDGLTPDGWIRRDYRTLIPWFRTWIPSNILLHIISISRRPLTEKDLFLAGRGFQKSSRELLYARKDFNFSTTCFFAGIGYRKSTRYLLTTQYEVSEAYINTMSGGINEAFIELSNGSIAQMFIES